MLTKLYLSALKSLFYTAINELPWECKHVTHVSI